MITSIDYEAPHICSSIKKILFDIIDHEIKNNIKISRLNCFLLFRIKQLAIKSVHVPNKASSFESL